MNLPKIKTKRLFLRPFSLVDAKDVQRLAGEKAISDTVLNIPYPYNDGIAENWIKNHEKSFNDKVGLELAITSKEGNYLIGAIGIVLNNTFNNGEMGYWVGKPYWNKGYCTEAGNAIIDYAFNTMKLHRIHASHFSTNLASGKVMQKIGMKKEGYLRESAKKDNVYKDLVIYGILRNDII
jgi:RimJ/RimL family protein N-acetyltransferase